MLGNHEMKYTTGLVRNMDINKIALRRKVRRTLENIYKNLTTA
jgi:hypothetical protein